MTATACPVLVECLDTCVDQVNSSAIRMQLEKLPAASSPNKNTTNDQCAALVDLYHQAVPLIEDSLWSQLPDDAAIDRYQRLFAEMETQIAGKQQDDRHHFVIVIPVADRPLHLRECIDSIFQLCQRYQYGGNREGRFSKVSVMVADDSAQPENIASNKQIASDYLALGLQVIYFGADEQRDIVHSLTAAGGQSLSRIIGALRDDEFAHKGASITRNISYLKLHELLAESPRRLAYFIDSDQEFRVNVATDGVDRNIYALNYFYHLDRLFSTTDTQVMTGKVVGDPPVSPAVMAGNFLDDVLAFFQEIATYAATDNCCFHQAQKTSDDASYHDMAELFGFARTTQAFRYHCPVLDENASRHNHIRCFEVFAQSLNHFFDGEHPTRKTVYEYDNVEASVKPARTVYTGNYVIRAEALKYFIPFATLKLRMAGPVLGRLIKADIGDGFVSAALPMLHKRTMETIGKSEYRAGIDHQQDNIDLSAEYERQYYGDVMLFSIEKLIEQGYPSRLDEARIVDTLAETEQFLLNKYVARHDDIVAKLECLKALVQDSKCWWNSEPQLQEAMHKVARFIANIEYNYGHQATGYQRIRSAANRQQYLDRLCQALLVYGEDKAAWQCALGEAQ